MPDDDVIELDEEVIQEVERRVEKRQRLVEDAEEKRNDFLEARDKAENQIDSNQTYMDAVANVNGVSMDDYVFDKEAGGLRPMTDAEKERREQMRQQSPAEAAKAANQKPVSTEMSTEDAVLQIREEGLDSIIIPDDEDRLLVMEAAENARNDN